MVSIGEYAFQYCGELKELTIPGKVSSIGEYAFNSCGLTSVTVPEGIQRIRSYTFANCTSLSSVEIPNGITRIEEYAFSSTALTNVTIPESVTIIGENCFDYCSKLESIDVAEGNGKYISVDGVLYNKAKTQLIQCPRGKTGTVAIPEGVTSIPNSAFYECTGLTSVTIPESVTSIGDSAYNRCTGLTSVTIPEGVTSIGEYAFSNCTGLTAVTISEGVTSIGNGMFCYCTGLTSVTIPEGVTSIGYEAFDSCRGLTSIILPRSVTEIGNSAIDRWNDNLTSYVYSNSYAETYCKNNRIRYELIDAPDHTHAYAGPVWTWSADHSTAVAVFTCAVCGDEQTVAATVKSATTATAVFNDKTYKEEVPIPVKGDVTGDGNVTMADVVLLNRYVVGLIKTV